MKNDRRTLCRTTAISLGLLSLAVNCSSSTDTSSSSNHGSAGQATVTGATGGAGASAQTTSASGAGSSGGAVASSAGSASVAGLSTGGAGAGDTSSAAGGSLAAAGAANGGASSGGASSGGGAGPATVCPAEAVFCDDFESYALMAAPSGKWKTWTVGNGTLLVDGTHGYSGTKAAHFHGKVSQSGASKEQAFMLTQQTEGFPVAGKTLFIRYMVYGTRFPFGTKAGNHSAYVWMGSIKALSSPDQGAVDQGYIFSDYNGVSIQAMWAGGVRDVGTRFTDADQLNGWHCWELEIDNAGGPPQGGTGVAMPHIWEDSTELKLTEKGSGHYAAIPFEAVLFSLWSPQTDTAEADYWVDDVVISKSRINCPAPK